jgi:hypothetical protein
MIVSDFRNLRRADRIAASPLISGYRGHSGPDYCRA